MRAQFNYKNVPTTLGAQLRFLINDRRHPYERAVEYVKTEQFTIARGFSDELTERQLVRELHSVIRNGAG